MITESMLKNTLGANIKRARVARHISQEKLAEMIGIEPSALSKIESGKSYPTTQTLTNIINNLKIKPYLLYITEKEYDLEQIYNETLGHLAKLKNNKESLIRVYDFIVELTK